MARRPLQVSLMGEFGHANASAPPLASVPSLENRCLVHLRPVNLTVVFVTHDNGVVAIKEFWMSLNESVGDFIRHHLSIGFVGAFVQSTVGNNNMIFKIETILQHCQRQQPTDWSVPLDMKTRRS
jgi:hypothetical protein